MNIISACAEESFIMIPKEAVKKVVMSIACFSAFIPASRAQPADLILESGSFLAKCGSLGG